MVDQGPDVASPLLTTLIVATTTSNGSTGPISSILPRNCGQSWSMRCPSPADISARVENVVELGYAVRVQPASEPRDQDVGHQAYPHKILTKATRISARSAKATWIVVSPAALKRLRLHSGVSAHSSTSISAGLGMAWRLDLIGGDNHVIAVNGATARWVRA